MSSDTSCNLSIQGVQQSITVANSSKATAQIQWRSSNPAVTVLPASAGVLSNSEQQMEVLIKGTKPGKLRAQVTCSLLNGTTHVVNVTAAVKGNKGLSVLKPMLLLS